MDLSVSVIDMSGGISGRIKLRAMASLPKYLAAVVDAGVGTSAVHYGTGKRRTGMIPSHQGSCKLGAVDAPGPTKH